MNVLCIDVGSYSVKFFEVKIERKNLIVLNLQEVVIDQLRGQLSADTPLFEIQKQIIQTFLNHEPYDGKVIFQLPNHLTTSRYLELPVTNKKKAELMIPFQLDENLPFPIAKAHFSTEMIKRGGKFYALINIIKTDQLDDFYYSLEQRLLLPSVLTTELSLMQHFVLQNKIEGPACILDLGHNTTKAYFIKDHRVISNHVSYVAGQLVNEVIAQTYNIPLKEAAIYKHGNCFLLTEEQYNDVDKDQQEFALLMKKTFLPLISDFKRWELGFRGKFALPLEKIYIIGGTSNIKNISFFLSQELNVPVLALDVFEKMKLNKVHLSSSENATYAITQLIAAAQQTKTPLANLLTGSYSSSFASNIPLHSTAFIAIRSAIISICLLLLLLGERIFINNYNKELTNQVTKLLKNPKFDIDKKLQRQFSTKPDTLLTTIKKKNETLAEELHALEMSRGKNAVSALYQLSKILSNNENLDLASFSTEQDMVTAKFVGKNKAEIDAVINYLKTANLNQAKLEPQKDGNSLTLKYRIN